MRMILLGSILSLVITIGVTGQEAGLMPGQRIGTVSVGMSTNEAIAAAIATFGSAPRYAIDCTNERDRERGLRCLARGWDDRGFDIIVLLGAPGQERVLAVVTERPVHRTAEGIGVESTLDEATRAYGEPRLGRGGILLAPGHALMPTATYRDTWSGASWRARGLGVLYDRSTRRITAVVVFAPEP